MTVQYLTVRSPESGVQASVTDVIREQDDLTRLADAAESLVAATIYDAPELSGQARAVVSKLRQRRFEVAVVGEFNRGKSTLLNSLVSRSVLPSGALPVTSITTELAHGDDEKVTVHYLDGKDEEVIDLNRLEQYVTEENNPGNALRVGQVEVSLPAPLLRYGAVLLDTPGLNSIFRQSSEAARETILQADGAIVVLSADAPLTDAERSLLKLLSRRSARTFFVLNRIDLLNESELERVRWFVGNVLEEICGGPQQLFGVSAKTGDGMAEFTDAFSQFLADGLDDARIQLARKDLQSLADRIDNECALQESALKLNAEELEDRLAQFKRAAGWQHDGYTDDSVLFTHAVERAEVEVREKVVGLDEAATRRAVDHLRMTAEKTPVTELENTLDGIIEFAVRAYLEPVRHNAEGFADSTWRRAAERYERATQRRNEKLRDIAGELFDVELTAPESTATTELRGHFFYSAPMHVEVKSGVFGRLLHPLGGERRGRQRLIAAAEARLAEESRLHAERLRSDLADRLHHAMEDLKVSMGERVADMAEAMTRAIELAQTSKASAEEEVNKHVEKAARMRRAAEIARTASVS